MREIVKQSITECNHNPKAFTKMLSEGGGVQAAKRPLTTPVPSEGSTTLWEKDRLDFQADRLLQIPTPHRFTARMLELELTLRLHHTLNQRDAWLRAWRPYNGTAGSRTDWTNQFTERAGVDRPTVGATD